MITSINEFKKYGMINENLSISNIMTHAKNIANTVLDNLTDEDRNFIENHKDEVLGKIKGDPQLVLNKLEKEFKQLDEEEINEIEEIVERMNVLNEAFFSKNLLKQVKYIIKKFGAYTSSVVGILSAITSIATTAAGWSQYPFLVQARELIGSIVGTNAAGPLGFLLLGISLFLIFLGSTVKKPTTK